MGKNTERINKLADKKKADKIVAFLKSKDKETRLDAIRALGKCGGAEAINALTTNIITPDEEEKIEVIKALGVCGKDASFYLLSHYAAKETNPIVKDVMREAMGQIRGRKED